jgi:beta-lactamase regulating signal transducer with metallopeptidase domain/uncharacterized GH25 family protein
MNAHPEMEKHLNWLLNHSLQVGALVLLVLLVQWIFRRQLTNRWRFALWWIVLVRLLLPFSPESAVSLFNFFQPHVRLEGSRYSVPIQSTALAKNNSVQISPPAVSPAQKGMLRTENRPATAPAVVASDLPDQIQMAQPVSTPVLNNSAIRPHSLSLDDFLIPGLAGLWLGGVLVLIGVVAAQLIRFYRKLAQASAPADENLQTLLDDCQREFGLSRRIELLETDAVQSPALFGLLRLRLLLPRGIGGQFAGRELRYIFFHELAHVKRGDLWLNWLVTALQIMHWFNPLLWLGFARLRADRELACDELALLRAGDKAGTAYGETVVKLLENLNRPAAIPGLVGILEDKKQMRRRISMIANFRKPSRWSVLAVFLVAAVAAAALTDAQSNKPADQRIKVSSDTVSTNSKPATGYDPYFAVENLLITNSQVRPDLTGTVSAKGGVPLPVPATIFIATAAPKIGSSTFCPSCYADCVKHARTDAQGGFKIESLDSQLTFQILAVAKGYKPKYVSKVDPAKDTPVKVELEPIESGDAAPDHSIRGRVVNPKGTPIEGAVVDMQGIETKGGGGSWGMLPGIDPLAVTDENGEFLITAKKPFEMMTVKVTARTFADKNFNKLASGAARHELAMAEGATLTGRVLLDGKPLAGVSVGVSAVDRAAGTYLGHFEVGTGERGNFVFLNLPPDGDFQIYSLMGTMKNFGAVPPRQIHTGKDGETTDAGDLIVGPAHRLAGRVVLSDGQPVPAQTRLLISRQEAWDSMQVTLDNDGNFDTTGVPSETISLSARTKGYHVSAQNLSVDQMNPFRLIGRVDHDITNLVFMLEKGPDPQPDYSHVDPEYGQSRQRSLRGAEGVPDHSREWTVSGRVLDSETKQPIQNFRVTPGQTDNFNRTAWSTLRAVDGSNGVYLTYVSKRVAQPLLKVEAEGYLPESAAVLPHDATNVDFVLKKGSGPAGTVVTPDGQPAVGATIILLGDDYNQAGLNSAGELTAYANRSASRTADTNGAFAFKPVWGTKSLAAASSNGFAVVSLESFATNSTITLELFGKITGTLKRTSGSGTNEILDVRFDDSSIPGLDRINLQTSATTDSQGRFAFERVPAGHLRITYREMMDNGHGWAAPPLQEIDLKPGATLEVNITAADRAKKEPVNSYQQPQPKLVPGKQVKGVVLLPNGKPAADADVALQVEGKYLGLGKGAFTSSNLREEGLLVSAGQDGSFTLPMYEKAQSVIALNEEGFAQVSLEQLKASPQITLQKWGRIEGTLRVGHHVGTNEQVTVSAATPRWSKMTIRKTGQQTNDVEITNASPAMLQLPFYDSNAFKARTDEQGRFVITFVPPGQQIISRLVPAGEGSWTSSQLASVDVKPGETTVTNVGGTGRTVIGKIKFTEGAAPDFKNGMGIISTPTFKFYEKSQQLKTDAERKAFYQSPEVEAAYKNHRGFSTLVSSDGSFRAEDVLPGTYEFDFQPHTLMDEKSHTLTTFTSTQEVVVPEAKDQDDDSSVDWGEVELKKFTIPIPEAAAGKK